MELLLHWMRKWDIDDEMLWKKAAIDQAVFIRDTICNYLLNTHAFVVSTHMSKSILLPVYAFTMRNGIKVICRENFYGWRLSVMLPKDRPHNKIIPTDILESGYSEDSSKCYFEGFKDEWLFEGYNPENGLQRNFSFGVYSNYNFYMIMYLLKHLYDGHKAVYLPEDTSFTKEEVMTLIHGIYDKFGYNEKKIVYNYRNEPCEEQVMHGWEILRYTYCMLTDSDFIKRNNLEYIHMDIVDDVDKFSDYILKYNEVRYEFFKEIKMYSTKF